MEGAYSALLEVINGEGTQLNSDLDHPADTAIQNYVVIKIRAGIYRYDALTMGRPYV